MDYLPDIPPDFGPQEQPQFSVDRARFGDGYVQSRPSGLNSVTDSIQVSWSLLTRDEFQTLYRFLKSRKGVHSFRWQAPWDDEVRKWRCEELSGTKPTSARFGSISASFEEDHNP